MTRALIVPLAIVTGLVVWVGSAWIRSKPKTSRSFGEHETMTSDTAFSVLRQPGPGRVTHYRSA